MNQMREHRADTEEPWTEEEDLTEHARQTFAHAAQQAKDEIAHQVDLRKEEAAKTMGNVANAIRETTKEEAGPMGDLVERAADEIDRLASFFRAKDVHEIATDVERFARREPVLFVGTALAIGLVGGRFLKSAASAERGGRDEREPTNPRAKAIR